MQSKPHNPGLTLMAELQNYEQLGISIWLDGRRSTPDGICDAVRVREDFTYMRDYVFREGELKEIRFDRID